MSILRMFRMGLRVAEWAAPHVKELHSAKHFNRTEGSRQCQIGNWAEAEKHLTLAVEHEQHAPKHCVQMMLELSLAQRSQSKLELARATAEAGVQLAQKLGDKASIHDALMELAEVHIAVADREGALATLSQAATLSSLGTKEHMGRKAKVLRKQGAILVGCGLIEEARQVLAQGLKLTANAYGSSHPEMANALCEMGALYREAGEHEAAQDALRQALVIFREASGYDSSEATVGLRDLARSLESSGHFDAAIEEYERILSARERQLGGSREDTAEVEARLALLYVNAGRVAAARELLTHAVGVLERTKGDAYFLALETLAVADEISGRPMEAARTRAKLASLRPDPELAEATPTQPLLK